MSMSTAAHRYHSLSSGPDRLLQLRFLPLGIRDCGICPVPDTVLSFFALASYSSLYISVLCILLCHESRFAEHPYKRQDKAGQANQSKAVTGIVPYESSTWYFENRRTRKLLTEMGALIPIKVSTQDRVVQLSWQNIKPYVTDVYPLSVQSSHIPPSCLSCSVLRIRQP